MDFKPEVKKVTVSQILVKTGTTTPTPIELDGDFVKFNDADGKTVKVSAKFFIMAAENLKIVNKNLNFFCLKHGNHYGANKGAKQPIGCLTCLDAMAKEVSCQGEEDDEG